MKLAQALIERAQLKEQIAELKERLEGCVLVQDGESVQDEPNELKTLTLRKVLELETYICKIQETNVVSDFDETLTLSDAIAHKDSLLRQIKVLDGMLDHSKVSQNRYSKTEIKFIPTINREDIQSERDTLAKAVRELDLKLQERNWQIELID